MKWPLVVTIRIVNPIKTDARGWISTACFSLVILVLMMMWADKGLLKDDFFKIIATAIILTGWNQGPVGWAFQATKSGGELADKNAAILQERARTDAGGAANDQAGLSGEKTPQEVIVTNPASEPVNTKAAP